MSKAKYDGWCMKAFGEILPWSFHSTRTGVVKWWEEWSLSIDDPSLKWENFRKRGTYKIIKVRIVEVSDEQ